MHSIGGSLASKDIERFMKQALDESFSHSRPIECPLTQKEFMAEEDDWLHLTEEDFHSRFPGNRHN
jgi:hypothetical protein